MLPKLISIGSFYLPTYGVMVALAFLAGLGITVKLARRKGLNAELVTNLAVYVALAGMLGAKILMIVFDWHRYLANPGDIFSLATLQAAGVFQGGLILALVTAILYMRQQKMPMLGTSDAFAPGLALGHAIGKVAGKQLGEGGHALRDSFDQPEGGRAGADRDQEGRQDPVGHLAGRIVQEGSGAEDPEIGGARGGCGSHRIGCITQGREGGQGAAAAMS